MNRIAKLVFTASVLLASLVLGPAALAEGKGKQSAESHYNKGMTAYTLGHFTEAIEEFEKAYELRSEPIFLYNIAQSHRQNDNPQRAVFFYRRYLEADPNAKKRAEVEARIAELQSRIDAQKERETAATAPPQQTGAPQPAPQPMPVLAPSAPVEVDIGQPAAGERGDGRGLRIGGLVSAGAGVGVGVTGIVLALHGHSLQDQAYSGQWDQSKYDSGKTFRTVGWVAMGVGAAAVATGAVLYIVGNSAKTSTRSGATGAGPSVALLPLLAPDAGGAAVLGRF